MMPTLEASARWPMAAMHPLVILASTRRAVVALPIPPVTASAEPTFIVYGNRSANPSSDSLAAAAPSILSVLRGCDETSFTLTVSNHIDDLAAAANKAAAAANTLASSSSSLGAGAGAGRGAGGKGTAGGAGRVAAGRSLWSRHVLKRVDSIVGHQRGSGAGRLLTPGGGHYQQHQQHQQHQQAESVAERVAIDGARVHRVLGSLLHQHAAT